MFAEALGEADLPAEAEPVIGECGGLPLAPAAAAGMVCQPGLGAHAERLYPRPPRRYQDALAARQRAAEPGHGSGGQCPGSSGTGARLLQGMCALARRRLTGPRPEAPHSRPPRCGDYEAGSFAGLGPHRWIRVASGPDLVVQPHEAIFLRPGRGRRCRPAPVSSYRSCDVNHDVLPHRDCPALATEPNAFSKAYASSRMHRVRFLPHSTSVKDKKER